MSPGSAFRRWLRSIAIPSDTEAEIQAVMQTAMAAGAYGVAVADVYGQGGAGAEELARLVMSVPQSDPLPVRLYDDDDSTAGEDRQGGFGDVRGRGDRLSTRKRSTRSRATNGRVSATCRCAWRSRSIRFSGNAGRDRQGRAPARSRFAICCSMPGPGMSCRCAGAINLMPGLGKAPGSNGFDLLPDGTVVGVI